MKDIAPTQSKHQTQAQLMIIAAMPSKTVIKAKTRASIMNILPQVTGSSGTFFSDSVLASGSGRFDFDQAVVD